MVLAVLVSMVVSPDKTVNSFLTSPTGEGSSMGKDVFYRLKNSPFICWRMIMWHLVHRFLTVTSQDSDVDDTSSRYLIFDDTTLSKTGKRIKDSYTAKRVEELDTNKIQMVLRMFFTAIYRGLRVDYVLVDSWFTCDALIQAIRSVKNKEVHLIGMYKFAKTKFEYQGKSLTHAQINNMLGKPRRCRSLGYQYKQAKVMYQGVEICLFFSRRGKHDNWKVLLTTDTKLTFKKLIEHYQVRWVVEVFNRESKQLLNLGKCQSSNFDAQVAETTISMIAYPKAEAMIMALYSSVMGKDD
jgi:predicted nucleic acid-binding Zn finger protein